MSHSTDRLPGGTQQTTDGRGLGWVYNDGKYSDGGCNDGGYNHEDCNDVKDNDYDHENKMMMKNCDA